ncbi:alanine--tRNA ligase [Candidatus Woesearchaeota archaeon]|nr:alanine--tRNA ligase [Candidatus Woesearchaeota archaeon]
MKPDKQVKREFKQEASKDPDRFYATAVLKAAGFMRKRCACGTFFWTVDPDKEVCGDPACSGGYRFFEKPPAKRQLDYIEVWKEFARLFKKWGYTPIARYPVVARWRDDTDFVQASIYDFQPYVVSGEVTPPAKKLVVPQFSLRFNDIDNVGVTGAHYTGFVMIGQHAFMDEKEWDQDAYFSDIHRWLSEGLGLPDEEITFHEDAWAGGGNFGPCMEYFSRGLELGNQVYMLYEQTEAKPKPLRLKVLDMGMGHERNAWFTKAASTSYETTFPTVIARLKRITGIRPDESVIRRFLPYASYLNVDEVVSIDAAWKAVAQNAGTDVASLRQTVQPLAAMYSVGEHARTLLVATSDGALPSNVGGGYNLRVILRRALAFIRQYGWDLDLADIAAWHAAYVKPIFPELSENLEDVRQILDVERRKYLQTVERSKAIVRGIISKDITADTLVSLYDSHGIGPDLIAAEAKAEGRRIEVPDNFYALVAERHEKSEQLTATVKEQKLDLAGIPDTEALYFDDYMTAAMRAKVLKVIGRDVVLDRTVFYPTSGGQLHDVGTIGGERVEDVFKQGAIIVHAMGKEPGFEEGDTVEGRIDLARRRQLAQHHTATHIINGAARKVLGNHVFQAGASKTLERARLDITHYEQLTKEQIARIEEQANAIVGRDLPVVKSFIPRDEAERKYGFRLYQGGAVPGKSIRVVAIGDWDVEACGGTHLNRTGETGVIRITKTSKISDGILRIEYTAGKATSAEEGRGQDILDGLKGLFGVEEAIVPARAEELFAKWKRARKAAKRKQPLDEDAYMLTAETPYDGDVVSRVAELFSTQPEHVVKTAKRFLDELEGFRKPSAK